ncbi:putative hydroxyacylglutathione hydrolase, partial [Gregarina niphandrodes]
MDDFDEVLVEAVQEEIRVPSRTRRRLAGSTLCCSLFVFLALLPVAAAGQLLCWLGRLLKAPLKALAIWIVPAAVRLWYIHRVGRVHPWQCARSRAKRNLHAHSRAIRIDVTGAAPAKSGRGRDPTGRDTAGRESETTVRGSETTGRGSETTGRGAESAACRGGEVSDDEPATGVPLAVHVIPQLHDNYAYLVVNKNYESVDAYCREYRCFIVDCANAEEVHEAMNTIGNIHYRDGNLRLEAILTTHHHWDHMGGNDKLPLIYPTISAIVGGRRDRVLNANTWVQDGDELELIGGARVHCHETAAHTLGSVAYRLRTLDRADCLFLGDTFFVGGCGATFEGSAEMMEDNFRRLYFTCVPATLLFPGHEYSERIVASLFPDRALNLAKEDPYRFAQLARQLGRIAHLRSLPHPAPTVPVPMGQEVHYNPQFNSTTKAARLFMAAVMVALQHERAKNAKTPALTFATTPRYPSASRAPSGSRALPGSIPTGANGSGANGSVP